MAEWRRSIAELRSRYDVLVIRAGSKAGKTEFCKALFPGAWEQLIEDVPAPNFRTFNPERHPAVLLDNVNSVDFILNNRGLLMARNSVHHLAQTATGLFTYPCYLHQTPIMVTMDIEKPRPQDSNWLQENCVVVDIPLGETLYIQADADAPRAPPGCSTDAQQG